VQSHFVPAQVGVTRKPKQLLVHWMRRACPHNYFCIASLSNSVACFHSENNSAARRERPNGNAGGFAQIWNALRESGSVLADSTCVPNHHNRRFLFNGSDDFFYQTDWTARRGCFQLSLNIARCGGPKARGAETTFALNRHAQTREVKTPTIPIGVADHWRSTLGTMNFHQRT